MTHLWTIFMDSLRESMDRWTLKVLLALSFLMVLFSFSISFTEKEQSEVLREHIEGMGSARFSDSFDEEDWKLTTKINDLRPVIEVDGLGDEFGDGLIAEVEFPKAAELDRSISQFKSTRASGGHRRIRVGSKAKKDYPAATLEDQIDYLQKRLKIEGWKEVVVNRTSTEPLAFRIAARVANARHLAGAHTASFLFGAMTQDLRVMSESTLIFVTQTVMIEWITGVIGMIVAVLATAGFLPDLMQKGTLDLTLARPISRVSLLLSKYVGGIWFIFMIAILVIGGSWVGFSRAAERWDHHYLYIIGVLVASFAVLYSVSVLVAVLTRNGMASAMVTLGVWLASFIVDQYRDSNRSDNVWDEDVSGWAQVTVDSLYSVLPKLSDFGSLGNRILQESNLNEGLMKQASEMMNNNEIDWMFSMGTSFGFAAACLAVACFVFSRRDY